MVRHFTSYAPDSTSSGGTDTSDGESIISLDDYKLQTAAQTTDWEALALICAELDKPGGPQRFNPYDYVNALEVLSIGPNTIWFAVYKDLGALKLREPQYSWSKLLGNYKRLNAMDTLFKRFVATQKAAMFTQWRHLSSQINIFMATCYEFENNFVVYPGLQKLQRVANSLENEFQLLRTKFALQALVTQTKAIGDRIHGYNQKSTALSRRFTAENTMRRLKTHSNATSMVLSRTRAIVMMPIFNYWWLRCECVQLTHELSKVTLNTRLASWRRRALYIRELDLKAEEVSRTHTFTSILRRMARRSSTIEVSLALSRIDVVNHVVLCWKTQKDYELMARNLQINSARCQAKRFLAICRLQTNNLLQKANNAEQSVVLRQNNFLKLIFRVWRLSLWSTVFSNSWMVDKITMLLRQWKLACYSEIYSQYRATIVAGRVIESWKEVAVDLIKRTQLVLAKDHYPRLAYKTLHILRRVVARAAENEDRANLLTRQFDTEMAMHRAVEIVRKIRALEEKAHILRLKDVHKQLFVRLRKAAEKRRIELLEIQCLEFEAAKRHKMLAAYLNRMHSSAKSVYTREKRVSDNLKRFYLEYFVVQYNWLAECEVKAKKVESLHLSQLWFYKWREAVENKVRLAGQAELWSDILGVELQESAMRHWRSRVMRYKSREIEAIELQRRNVLQYRKRIWYHWFHHAVGPTQPMTPRSARRLPPSTLRKYIDQASKRPETTPFSTPTKVNRQLEFQRPLTR